MIDNKEINMKLNKEQLKRLSEPFSDCIKGTEGVKKKGSTIQKEFRKAQSGICGSVEFEILNLGYDSAESKSNNGSISQSEPSTSKNFSANISNSNKSDFKIFLQQNSEELQYLAVKNANDGKNKNCDTSKVNEMNAISFQYPVERIKLYRERKSNEEDRSSKNLNFSESLFSDINCINSREQGYYRCEEKLFNLDELAQDVPLERKKLSKRKLRQFCYAKCLCKKSRQSKEQRKIKYSDAKDTISPGTLQSTLLNSKVTPEEDLETKRQLLDFFIYIIHLILITTIALSMVSSNMFYFTHITTSMFFDTFGTSPLNNTFNDAENYNLLSKLKTLRESQTSEDFWAFAETTMLDMLYWNFYYSGINPASHAAENDRKMLYGNQILGVARMRQVRVRNDSCKIHPKVRRFFDTCYFYYSVFTEETTPIKWDMEKNSTATAWVYTEAKELQTSYYWGEISIYGGGGYYLDLGKSRDETVKMIQELKQNFWISKATRAIFIDFNIYNANANLFCICKIVLEFPPVGGILPVADFHSLKIIRYLNTSDFFILGCEFLYILFAIYYTWQTFKILIRQKRSFFFFFWNYLDLVILLMSYFCICLSIVRYVYVDGLMSTLSNRYDEYTEFNLVKTLQIAYNNNIAVLLFFCWLKLFKYFNFNAILLEFKLTLARSLKDILGFFPMFLTMFLAFALLAYLLFGNQVKTYKTLWLSFLTLLQAFLGEFYYTDIVESNRILGPFFYVAFIFFIFFVLLNVFIAIINDAYASVKSQVILEKPRTGEYMKRGLFNIFTCNCFHHNKKLRIKQTRKRVLFQEIETALKKAGFSMSEIKVFFYKYNINFSNFLEENTKKRIVKDLELKRIDFSETSEQVQINALRRRLDNLTNRIGDLETHLQPVLDKVDALLQRL